VGFNQGVVGKKFEGGVKGKVLARGHERADK